MKKTLLFVMMITFILCTSCTEKKTPDPIQSNQIILNETGITGSIHDPQTSWEFLELKDFVLWTLYIKKDRLEDHFNSSQSYWVMVNGQAYQLRPNPLNPNILKLLLPSRLKPEDPGSLVIKTTDARENGMMKNDLSLAIEYIYITKEENNGTCLNQISLEDYTTLYSAGTDNFAYDNGQFIRPSHVKSNEENAYTVNTYFDARTVATTESATGAFQFLKDVDNYEQYIIMENPNHFQVTGDSTELRVPDDRWRIRQLGSMGPLDGNHVFNIVDDPTQQQFVLSIHKATLPATYKDTYIWETQLKEATVCWFDKTNESNRFETIIAYTDALSTELILNSRFEAVTYHAPEIRL